MLCCHHLALQVIQEKLGIKHGCITTIHDVTNTQVGALQRSGRWGSGAVDAPGWRAGTAR